MKTTEQLLTEILEKLDLILRVQSLLVASEKSVTEGAIALKLAGVDNQTIADILNTTPATIRTLTTKMRSKK